VPKHKRMRKKPLLSPAQKLALAEKSRRQAVGRALRNAKFYPEAGLASLCEIDPACPGEPQDDPKDWETPW